MGLLLFGGISFLFLCSGIFSVSGLLDFALIDFQHSCIVGYFCKLFLHSNFFFIKSLSKKLIGLVLLLSMILHWVIYAVLMLIMADTTSNDTESKTCNCQHSDPVQQSHTAEIIQTVHKPFILALSFSIIIVTWLFQMEADKAGGIQAL
jgi:hypothetical protein